MKILIQNDSPAAHMHHRVGIANCLKACGYDCYVWDSWNGQKNVFDIFDEYNPDIFWGQSYNLTSDVFQCLIERPNLDVILRASDWGKYSDEIDLNYYKILVANQEEVDKVGQLKDLGILRFLDNHYSQKNINDTHSHWIENEFKVVSNPFAYDLWTYEGGETKEQYKSDIIFISSCHAYKELGITPWIRKMLFSPLGKYNIKIYSTWNWGGVPAWAGHIPTSENKHALKSSKITISVGEPHQSDPTLGYDQVERHFYCAGLGTCMISDYIRTTAEDFFSNNEIIFARTPEEFRDRINYCLAHIGTKDGVDQDIEEMKQRARYITLNKHTYFERIANLFTHLELKEDAKCVMNKKVEIFEKMGLSKYL